MPNERVSRTTRRILLVEDDPSIIAGLRINLRHEGFQIEVATDGEEGVSKALDTQPDLILLDVMLPNMNGYEVLRELRRRGCTTAIIMLTAKGLEEDKVLGLELGADDYVQKPFGLPELLARIDAVLRRTSISDTSHFTFGENCLDFNERRIYRNQIEVQLSKKELNLLIHFVRHPKQVFTREQLLDLVWDMSYDGTERTVDNFVSMLRKKLEANSHEPAHFLTVRGIGYRFEP